VPNGIVDQADYVFWKSHFGNVLMSGAASNSNLTLTPEPAAQYVVVPKIALSTLPTTASLAAPTEVSVTKSVVETEPSIPMLNRRSEILNPKSVVPRSSLRAPAMTSAHDFALLLWLGERPNRDRPVNETRTSIHAYSNDKGNDSSDTCADQANHAIDALSIKT
jgi:hypothetical protein